MAWCVDVRFKQGDVTEFFVAEKESVTNIHKRLKMYAVSVLLIKTLLDFRLHELQILRKS
jgi:hypothetical protein